jgi:GMP synthase (glutamine-hydrolysing)
VSGGIDRRSSRAAPVVVIRHVEREGPHRIATALASEDLRVVDALAGADLPATGGVAGAVVMGGPMNADDVAGYPGLARERRWLERALEARSAPGFAAFGRLVERRRRALA